MKVLIVSDTHGNETNLLRVIKKEGAPDCMIHLGDGESGEDYIRSLIQCPAHMVAGNCDFFTTLPKTKIVEMDGIRILLTHGHYYYVSMGTDELVRTAKANGCSVAMFGHTHKPLLDQKDSMVTVLNPGSLTQPRQEGRRPSYVIMETKEGVAPEFSFHYL